MSVVLMVLVLAWSDSAPVAVIRWGELHQVIDGFGGSCADSYDPLPQQMADFFFTRSGIGLSLLRIQVVPSVADCESYFVPDGGKCVKVKSGATILEGELECAKQAVARGVTVWSTPWSPPASMKSNASFTHGGHLLPSHYSAWADSLAGYVKLLKREGVPIYAMSVQNEPDMTTDYGSALFTGQELHDFVPHLHSSFESAGLANTKIMIAESAQWDFSLTAPSIADPLVGHDVDILAAHGYGKARIVAQTNYGKQIWQTEDSSQSAVYDGSVADALSWASKIHAYLTVANVNAWHWWFLSDGPRYGNGTDNAALTDMKLNYAKRAYMTGQWSKFVRPGWHRIGVTYSGPLEISAFKSGDNQSFAIVAVNSNRKVIDQTFSLEGFTASTVTPWVTSSTLSLAMQPVIPVVGNSFTYRLLGKSVTSFVGKAGNVR
jgi:glucuronoarabinoxylan endo-1,4-beta-xylanase